MSAATWAVIVGGASMAAAYVAKRLVDYLLPPGRHWPLFERWSIPNEANKETPDEE